MFPVARKCNTMSASEATQVMFKVLFGVLFGEGLVIAGVVLYLLHGNVPVAVDDKPFPYEKEIVSMPLGNRIDREMIQIPPIQPSEENFVAGAHLYADKCAVCHAYHGQDAPIGENMFPVAPRLWEKHHNSPIVGVSDDPPGATYWKVANGIRLTGMPEFRTQMTDTELWQVSLLLSNADKPLPPAAVAILHGSPLADNAPVHHAAAVTAVAPPPMPAQQSVHLLSNETLHTGNARVLSNDTVKQPGSATGVKVLSSESVSKTDIPPGVKVVGTDTLPKPAAPLNGPPDAAK